jgi:hypothetical protein
MIEIEELNKLEAKTMTKKIRKEYAPIRTARDPDCSYCKKIEATEIAPSHGASRRCLSGSRNHCTCSACF